MNDSQRRIHWPALGAAMAIALAATLGLASAMNAGATDDSYLATVAAAGTPPRTEVSIQPQRIEVIAVREHPTVQGFWLAGRKHAG